MPRQSILNQVAEISASQQQPSSIPFADIGLDINDPENRTWLLKPLTCKEAAAELNTTANALSTLRYRGRGPA